MRLATLVADGRTFVAARRGERYIDLSRAAPALAPDMPTSPNTVTFEAAKGAFCDACALTEFDHSDPTEERWRVIGLGQGGVLFVVFTERSNDIIRIISARRATRHEQDRCYRQAFPQR